MSDMQHYLDLIEELKSQGKDISMMIKNINTNGYGTAYILPDGRVAIFEGDSYGADDYISSIENFEENYEIEKIFDEYDNEYGDELE